MLRKMNDFNIWVSVLFSRSVMSDSLQPHGLQHTRLPCPSPTPGAYSNSCPSRWWCHPTISSSVVPFLGCLWWPVQFSHSVMSNSLWLHGLQHARLPCPSPTPGTYSNSCPSSWWCHPTVSSSVIPFSHLQCFPASGSFQWISSSHQVAKVLELQFQHQPFQWIFRTDFL